MLQPPDAVGNTDNYRKGPGAYAGGEGNCFLCGPGTAGAASLPVSDREKLLSILSEMADAAFIIDRDMAVSYANPAAGARFPDAAGTRCHEGLAGRDTTCPGCAVIRCLESGVPQSSCAELKLNDGSRRRFDTSVTPISDQSGNISECVVVARDMTSFMSAEIERREMLSMLSHDIRTPLSVIRMNVDMLLSSEAARDDVSRASLESISRAAHNTSVLLDDFITLSRLGPGGLHLDLSPAPLSLVVRAALGQLRGMVDEREATVLIDIPDDLPYVEVDMDRFGRVITNVLSNALKHGQRGVNVRITARGAGDTVILEVADDGPGIPSEDLLHILDRRLSRVKDRRGNGHGLGLMIVKTIMELHRGGVAIACGDSGGTTVRLTLPTAPSTH